MNNTANDQNVERAIRKLWSEDDLVRELGSEEVLEIGAAAASSLVSLLTELVENPYPRFVVEKEEEGRLALDRYMDLVRRTKEPLDDCEEYRTVDRLAINSRLISDAISLLAELRATEAAPILVRIMENRETAASEPTGIEIEALRRIGSPAVPDLIRSIQTAHITAARFQGSLIFGYVISLGSGDELENSEDPELSEERYSDEPPGPTALDPETRWELERRTFKIKEKAIKVLGEIGDTEALLFLESLTKTLDNRPLLPSVLAAIRQIVRESPSGSGPAAGKP